MTKHNGRHTVRRFVERLVRRITLRVFAEPDVEILRAWGETIRNGPPRGYVMRGYVSVGGELLAVAKALEHPRHKMRKEVRGR